MAHITNTIGADILVLDMPFLDMRTKADTLADKYISDKEVSIKFIFYLTMLQAAKIVRKKA